MFITIKTSKGNFHTSLNITRHGKYGKYFLTVNGDVLCSGTLEYCTKIQREYISGKRTFSKYVIKRIEWLLHQRYISSLPKIHFITDKERPYYVALGYRTKKVFDWLYEVY